MAKKGVSKEAAAVSSFNLRSAFHFLIKGAYRAVILCWKDSPLVCWGHSLPLELELNPPPPQHPHAPAFPFLWHSVSCIAPLKHFPLLGSSHSSLIMSSRVIPMSFPMLRGEAFQLPCTCSHCLDEMWGCLTRPHDPCSPQKGTSTKCSLGSCRNCQWCHWEGREGSACPCPAL